MGNPIRILIALSAASRLFVCNLAEAKVIRSYSWRPGTSIDPVTWTLTNGSYTFSSSTKPFEKDTPGMRVPWISGTLNYRPGGKAIAVSINRSSPADDANLQKTYYRLINGTNRDAPSVIDGSTKYVGFAFNFDTGWQLTNGTGSSDAPGTGIYQNWQGSGWPALQLRTDESGDEIRLFFIMGNDKMRGTGGFAKAGGLSASDRQVVYLGDCAGNDLKFTRGQWYSIVIQFNFDYSGSDGHVSAWVDGTPAADWAGNVGYTPESQGGQSGTTDGVSVEVGVYQTDTGTNHKLFLDEWRYADSFLEAQP